MTLISTVHYPLPRLVLSLSLYCLCAVAQSEVPPGEIRVQYWQNSVIDGLGPNDDTNVPRNEYYFGYQWQGKADSLKVAYAHQPLLIRSGEPAHNGYFHLLDGSWRRCFGLTEIELTAGVHGSSNMFRHGEYHREILVGSFSLMRTLQNPAAAFGLNGDHRFGHFQVYPRLRWNVDLAAGSKLVFDLPIALYWRSSDARWQLGFERYGEKWATLDDQEQGIESALYIEEWRFGGRWRPSTGSSAALWELGAGLSFGTRVEYLDLNNGRRESDLDSAMYANLGLRF